MGIGPLVAWRRASLRSLGRTFVWPAGVALVTGLVLLVLGAGSSIPGLIGYTFAAFVLASIVLEFARGTSARHATASESWPRAFSSLVGRNRRRYGGYVVHAAIVLLAIGIVGSSAYDTKRAAILAPGQSMRIGDYMLAYEGTRYAQVPNVLEGRAAIRVTKGGDYVGTLHPGKNFYAAEQQTSREVAIRSDLLTGEDLFLNADDLRKDGSVRLEASVKPLVNLIWLAGLVFILGSVVAMWPDAPRAAAARDPLRRPSRASRARDAPRSSSPRCSRSPRSSSSRCRSCASRRSGRRKTASPALDPPERRRLALLEERDQALGGALGAGARPPHGQDLRRGLPRAGRAAQGPRGGRAEGARAHRVAARRIARPGNTTSAFRRQLGHVRDSDRLTG